MLPKLGFLARLTRESELKITQNGTQVCNLGLACSEKYGDKESTLFIDGAAFKKTAELISTIGKGQRVYVFGKIKTNHWPDRNTGQNRSKITMIIDDFEYIEPKNSQSQQNNPHRLSGQPVNPNYSNQGNQSPPDDDIPF